MGAGCDGALRCAKHRERNPVLRSGQTNANRCSFLSIAVFAQVHIQAAASLPYVCRIAGERSSVDNIASIIDIAIITINTTTFFERTSLSLFLINYRGKSLQLFAREKKRINITFFAYFIYSIRERL